MSRLRDHDEYSGPIGRRIAATRNAIRRMAVKLTSRALWQLVGYGVERANEVEVFSGIGFYSRPSSLGSPEAIVVKVGGASSHAVVIATRDEFARAALEPVRDLAENETAMHNTLARVHIKADGTVEIDDGSGAVPLALKTDVDALRTWVAAQFSAPGHTHGVSGASTNSVSPVSAPGPTPVSVTGTTVLKGK